ncbi:MAG: hypothetical protein ABUS79_24535, partial [Pseudomonadota bacterium]
AEDEAFPGEVVFSSADAGHGIRDDDGAPALPAEARSQPARAGEAARAGQRLIEEPRETLEFLERLMAESTRTRGGN